MRDRCNFGGGPGSTSEFTLRCIDLGGVREALRLWLKWSDSIEVDFESALEAVVDR